MDEVKSPPPAETLTLPRRDIQLLLAQCALLGAGIALIVAGWFVPERPGLGTWGLALIAVLLLAGYVRKVIERSRRPRDPARLFGKVMILLFLLAPVVMILAFGVGLAMGWTLRDAAWKSIQTGLFVGGGTFLLMCLEELLSRRPGDGPRTPPA